MHDDGSSYVSITANTIYLDVNPVKIYLKIEVCVRTRRLSAWGAETPRELRLGVPTLRSGSVEF
jgi:hypothetical protein